MTVRRVRERPTAEWLGVVSVLGLLRDYPESLPVLRTGGALEEGRLTEPLSDRFISGVQGVTSWRPSS